MHLHASLGRITNDLAFMQQQHLSLRRLMKPFEPVGEGKCRCCSMYAAKSVILSGNVSVPRRRASRQDPGWSRI